MLDFDLSLLSLFFFILFTFLDRPIFFLCIIHCWSFNLGILLADSFSRLQIVEALAEDKADLSEAKLSVSGV